LKYLVNWEGHRPTWEPFDCLTEDTQEALNDYHAEYPDRPGPHTLPCTIQRCRCKNPSSYL
jgi:hypothetical protein